MGWRGTGWGSVFHSIIGEDITIRSWVGRVELGVGVAGAFEFMLRCSSQVWQVLYFYLPLEELMALGPSMSMHWAGQPEW